VVAAPFFFSSSSSFSFSPPFFFPYTSCDGEELPGSDASTPKPSTGRAVQTGTHDATQSPRFSFFFFFFFFLSSLPFFPYYLDGGPSRSDKVWSAPRNN